MLIRIKDLRLRTIIGINDWERENKQDIVINIELEFNGRQAGKTDNIADTVNYKAITKQIINEVENSEFYLLEKLSSYIIKIVMQDERVRKASVEIDKPHALRFADSVSVTCYADRT